MPKLIKVDNLVYDQLRVRKGSRDTFSDVIKRLLVVRADDRGIVPQLDTLTMSIRDLADRIGKTIQGR